MTISINGRIGTLLLFTLGIVVGIGLVAGFALPAPLVGVWLAMGCILALLSV